MDHAELLGIAKWAVGILGGAIVFVCTAIGFLFRIAYRLGSDAREIKTALGRLAKLEEKVEKVPILETRVGTLEESLMATRSDIKHLLRNSSGQYGE